MVDFAQRPARCADVVLDRSEPAELAVMASITQTPEADVRATNSGDRTTWKLSAAADADIAAGDRDRHGALVLAVVGRPSVPEHPEDGPHHLVCTLELVEG